jgi:hypothetical protein
MGVAKSKDGSKAVNTIAFYEGTAVVTMDFDSPVNATLPEGFPVTVAQKQMPQSRADWPDDTAPHGRADLLGTASRGRGAGPRTNV